MMNSEKIKEIKKALEYAIDMGLVMGKNTMFVNIKLVDILTYINELESENEELKKYRCNWLNSEKMHLQADMEDTEFELASSNRILEKVSKENQTLKDRIAELEEEKARLDKVVKHFQELIEDGKLISSEQLKQFAERLKEKCEYNRKQYCCEATVSFNDIDETLKEFLL